MPKLAFIHTSPAAISPLVKYFKDNAPEYDIVNLLDDGILQYFKENNDQAIVSRLRDMMQTAGTLYKAELAVITCSSVSKDQLETLKKEIALPLLKVDIPMASKAVSAGTKIGLIISFAPSQAHSTKLIEEQAKALGQHVEIVPVVVDGAYDALLGGDKPKHDELLLAEVEARKDEVDVFVLSQVSMSALEQEAKNRSGKPVLSSPGACLEEIRNIMKS